MLNQRKGGLAGSFADGPPGRQGPGNDAGAGTALDTPLLEIPPSATMFSASLLGALGRSTTRCASWPATMLRSMYTAKGIGLAAPQVGIHQQLLVIDLDLENAATPHWC